MPIDLSSSAAGFQEDRSGPVLLIPQRKNTSGFTAVSKDGYNKGYACGYAQGEWESHTTGPHVLHPQKAKTPQQCGLGEFKWYVVRKSGERSWNEDHTAQVYPEWIKAFNTGYFDGWYDGRKVVRPPDVWGTGPMPPPEGGHQGMFTPTWKDPITGVEVQTPVHAWDVVPINVPENSGTPDGAGSESGGASDALARKKAVSDGAAILIGAGVVAAVGVAIWAIASMVSKPAQ